MLSNVKHRPNKQAKGLTKHYERRQKMGRTQQPSLSVGTLIVKGTFDHFAGGKWLYVKKVKVEHPTDKGYFKEVFVLTDRGKSRLKVMKQLKNAGLPLWEYMAEKK